MKGILKNTPAGWFVLHQVMRDEITSGYDSIPLRPDSESLWMFAELKEGWKDQLDGKEVYFEIERYCKKHNSDPSKNSVCTLDCGYEEVKYARVIWPSSETATLGCSYPDCICQGDEITYCNNRTPEQVVLGDKTALVENLFYQKEYILDNKEVEASLPGCELSDIDSLKYFFQAYLYSVENGKPDQNKATLLKTWIDIIQQRSIKI